ncbi:MAG: c-type cytochrome [Candidatus Sulfotelmatobacter sp.]|jgi:putative heme-binding domain-containing protein
MLSNSKPIYALAAVLVATWGLNGTVASAQTRRQNPQQQDVNTASTRGKQTFSSTCAGCHGLDGRGGERAPNIAENPRVQRLSHAEIARIIENGLPGTGMPAFRSLGHSDINGVITYLRTLQGAKKTVKLPGDAKRGETIFFRKAGCSGCHMIGGKGGFIASDLSGYARSHAVEQTRTAIISPSPGNRKPLMVTATMRGGEKYVGRILNEDNFSLQLQTLDGTFHFLLKADSEMLTFSSQTAMHMDYASTLSPNELDDVVSYLMSVSNPNAAGTPTKVEEEE